MKMLVDYKRSKGGCFYVALFFPINQFPELFFQEISIQCHVLL